MGSAMLIACGGFAVLFLLGVVVFIVSERPPKNRPDDWPKDFVDFAPWCGDEPHG